MVRGSTSSGGDISLSTEETNRLRASLGLKPLVEQGPSETAKTTSSAPDPDEGHADDLRHRVQQRKRRRQEERLKKVKTLGEADAPEDNDVAAWVQKSRTQPEAAVVRQVGRGAGSDDQQGESDADGEDYTAQDLAGLKVRHDIKDIAEGEAVILTLADKGILDEKGELVEEDDELENVLKAEEKRRKKAREAATKKSVALFEEDGRRRNLLDKYDEEEEEMLFQLGNGDHLSGQVNQEDVKRKLAEAGGTLLDNAVPTSVESKDYYTEGEMAAFTKPKKKTKRKVRKKEAVMDWDALEEDVAATGATGSSDLGSKKSRETSIKQKEEEEFVKQAERTARFDRALEKANWAAQVLRPGFKADEGLGLEEEGEVDDELYQSLARARRVALSQRKEEDGIQTLAQQLGRKREEEEALAAEQARAGLEFNETSEFVRGLQVIGDEKDVKDEDDSYMDIDEAPRAVASASVEIGDQKKGSAKKGPVQAGGWVNEAQGELAASASPEVVAEQNEDRPSSGPQTVPLEQREVGVTGEKPVGRGLAGALALLHEKGALKNEVEWSGRTNDKKKSKLLGLEDVYTGGTSEDRIARDVEAALTQRDEFGRIMTPKERFRDLSYKFHGKMPSKNKQEKRMKQYHEEITVKKLTSSENPSSELDRLRTLQEKTGTPYLVLQGKGSTASKAVMPDGNRGALHVSKTSATPVLGGGITPLSGDRKVEVMLGIRKPEGASGSMAPPPSRKPKS